MASKIAYHVRWIVLAAVILLAGLPMPSTATSLAPIGKANPVIDAVRSGDTERLSGAMTANPEQINRADALGRTALHYAARLGETEATALLLSAGAAPDPVDGDGYTPLMRAVIFGHTGAAAALLDAGADGDRLLPTGATLLDLAREANDPQMRKLFTGP